MAPTKLCLMPDCGKPVLARALCPKHYSRWKSHGDPNTVTVRAKSICSEAGCGEVVAGRGMCRKHYQRTMNSRLACDDPESKKCSVANCQRAATKRGLCGRHYSRSRNAADPSKRRVRDGENHCGKPLCPAAKTLLNHVNYAKNVERSRAKSLRYRAENLEKVRKRQRELFSRPEVREARNAKSREWSKANPAKTCFYARQRRLHMKQAAPSWLTDDDWGKMNAFYFEAKRLTEETGVEHHVDHIVPLKGLNVCGLHIPSNLRVLPALENVRRPRIYQGDD